MKQRINILLDKDDKKAYDEFLLLEKLSLKSNELYEYFNEFIKLLNNEKSYIKVRGFRMIMTLARWDINNKIDENISFIISSIDDSKPTSVRQCLKALNELIEYKSKLNPIIKKKLLKLDTSKYKDTMKPLIEKDINDLINKM